MIVWHNVNIHIACYVFLSRLDVHYSIINNLYILSQDYEIDGVDMTKVDFEDNQECLDLFEKVFIYSLSFSISFV